MTVSIAPTLGVNWMTNLLVADVGGPTIAYNPTFGQTVVYSGDERGDLSAISESNGQPLWSTSLGLGDAIYSTPVISTDQSSVWAGTAYNPTLYKLATSTGAIECTERQMLAIEASPTEGEASNGTEQVYIATLGGAHPGPVMAYRESDCSLMFSSNPYKTPDTGTWASASYGIDANGRELVLQGTSDPDNSEYAIDATSGQLDWYFNVDHISEHDIGAASTVSAPGNNGFADGVDYIIDKNQTCYAVDLTTGNLIWSFDFGKEAGTSGTARSTGALDGNALVFGMANGVYALNATTGAKLWHYVDPSKLEVISSPAIVGPPGQEVVAFGDLSGEFHVLSLANGTELYHYQTGYFITGSPSYVNGHFLIASADGFLYDFAAGGGNGAHPKTSITKPKQGSTVPYAATIKITGSATDATGVSAAEVAVQMGGATGTWFNAAAGTWNTGALTNLVSVAHPGAKTTNWSITVPVPTSGTTLQVYANAVNVAHLADISGAQVGFAVHASKSAPQLNASAVFIAPGATFGATGTGFKAGETVAFSLAGTVIGTATANSAGTVSASLTLPTKSLFGVTPLTATGKKSESTAFTQIDIANTWPQAGDGPEHTAYEANDPSFESLIAPGGNTFLALAWYYTAGAAVESSPAIYDGTVYFGDDAGTLAAVGTDTAAPLWTVNIPSGAAIRSTPAVDPTTGDLSFTADDGNVYVVTAIGGTQVGSATIGGLPTSPTVYSGTIYVGSDNASLTSLNEQTGTQNWSQQLAGAVHSTPALDTTTGDLVVGDDSGAISAFNAASGTLLWQVQTGGAVTAPPAIANGVVYVGSGDGNLYAINETSGTSAWTYAAGTPITSGAVYDAGLKLIYAGGTNGLLYAVNAATGHAAWTSSPQGTKSPFVGVSAMDEFAFANQSAGSVIAFNTSKGGGYHGYHKTAAGLTTEPTLNDGTVYIGASDGGVYAYTSYGNLPQIIPAQIRRSDAARALARARNVWSARHATMLPSFSWKGQRDVAIHIDATVRRAAAAAPLRFHGGSVQNAPSSYVVFWKPVGTAFESRYIPALTAALKAGAANAGGKLAGTFVDSTPSLAQLSDAAVQSEIAKAIVVNRWPTGVNTQFLLFTAAGTNASNAGFCSYHSAFTLGRNRAKPVVYAVVPYSGAIGACGSPVNAARTGDPAIDAATVNLQRAQRELRNDPLLDGWQGADGGDAGPGF